MNDPVIRSSDVRRMDFKRCVEGALRGSPSGEAADVVDGVRWLPDDELDALMDALHDFFATPEIT